MSVAGALQFIRRVREDEALRGQVRALGTEADEKGLARIGAAAGLEFTVEELRAAFEHDWRMRWLHYGARHTYQQTLQPPPRPGSLLPGD